MRRRWLLQSVCANVFVGFCCVRVLSHTQTHRFYRSTVSGVWQQLKYFEESAPRLRSLTCFVLSGIGGGAGAVFWRVVFRNFFCVYVCGMNSTTCFVRFVRCV